MTQGYQIDFIAGLNSDLKKRIDGIDDPVISARIYKEIGKIIKEERENDNGFLKPIIEVLKDPYKLVERYLNYLRSDNKRESTIYDYCYEAKKFMGFLEKKGINYIDLDVVREYLADRKRKGKLSSNGFRKLVFSLKSFLMYLKEIGLVIFDLEEIKSPKGIYNRQEIVTDTDFEKIVNYLARGEEKYKNCNLRDTVIIYLLIDCGLRKQELIDLNWEDIDFGNGIIKIRDSKGGRSREVPFGPELGRLLKECRKIFGHYKGAVIRGIQGRKRMHRTSLQDTVRRIYKKSGVYRKGLKNHSFRHAYATKVFRETDILTTQERLGHSRINTTEKYLHLYEDDMKRGVIDFPLPGKDGNHKN